MVIKVKRFLFVSILLLSLSSVFSREALALKIISLEGNVEVLPSGEEAWIAGESSMLLKKGDSLKTGVASYCNIALREHVFKVKENTTVTLAELTPSKIILELAKGDILSKLEKLSSGEVFEIKSPVAIGGVRGTSFLCSYSDTSGTEVVSVFEEEVVLSSLGEIEKYVTLEKLQKAFTSRWSDARLVARGRGILSKKILGEMPLKKIEKGISLKASSSVTISNYLDKKTALQIAERRAKKKCIQKLGDTLLSQKIKENLSIWDIIKNDPEKLKALYNFIYKKAHFISGKELDNTYNMEMELKLEGLNPIIGYEITSYSNIIEEISEADYRERFGSLAHVTTKRAAQVDGYRRLAEKIYGVVIDSETTVGDFAASDDTIINTVEGAVRGADILDTEYFSDGSVAVIMESGGNRILGELKKITGDIYGTHYISVPVPIEIKDFDSYLGLEGY